MLISRMCRFFSRSQAEPTRSSPHVTPRVWGQNRDGSRYRTGITVGALRALLANYQDSDEVCVAIECGTNKNHLGVIERTQTGSTGQMWLEGHVLDESLEWD